MPYAILARCRRWQPGECWHRGPLSARGLCKRCGDAGPSIGGSVTGPSKQRKGNNSRFIHGQYARTKVVSNFRTWKSIALRYEDFEVLLCRMHKAREEARAVDPHKGGPFLHMSDVPACMRLKYEPEFLQQVVHVMGSTKFCQLDRYKDHVSVEILSVLKRRTLSLVSKCLVAVLTRFRQSPRRLAPNLGKMLSGGGEVCLEDVVSVSKQHKRGVCYRQTGITDKRLHGRVLKAVHRIAAKGQYPSWERLEHDVATKMKACCNGTKVEHFSARQVAPDLCVVPGLVEGLSPEGRPVACKLGVGAVAGSYHAARAGGGRGRRVQYCKKIPFRKQTGLCEYHKLVSRLNFSHVRKRAKYKSAARPC